MGYYRDENTGQTIKRNVPDSKTQVITDEEILQIGAMVKKIKQHYGCPQDIEWAIDEKRMLYLLQARPITTLA